MDHRLTEAQVLEVLRAALPLIARFTGGSAMLADADGRRILTIGHDGTELPVKKGTVHELARRAWEEGRPLLGPSERHPNSLAVAIPLGAYVLAASNGNRLTRESQLLLAMQVALPLIAKVAGGEGVIFDREGCRMMSVLPDGTTVPSRVGTISEKSRLVMESGRSNISPSNSTRGAIAVRIPMTQEWGFGFNNALAVQKEQKLLEEIKRRPTARYSWSDIIGNSSPMQRTVAMAKRAAATTSPVWVFGETGTGKELIAQAIHNASLRNYHPFIAINCAALPSSLVESSLFGYVDGAFTGARRGGQAGLFEEANGGTLLLDEISEMDLSQQAKLLRVLQEGEVARIGSSKTIPVDLRMICTSNQDLARLVQQNKFREDLFYRLNVVDIRMPALRERRDDIPLLVERFLTSCSLRVGKLVTRIHPDAMARLMDYNWPGNVRELQNCVERAIVLTEEEIVLERHLPPRFVRADNAAEPVYTLEEVIRNAERNAVIQAMQETGGNRTVTADRLGISVTTLWRKLREYGYATSDGPMLPS